MIEKEPQFQPEKEKQTDLVDLYHNRLQNILSQSEHLSENNSEDDILNSIFYHDKEYLKKNGIQEIKKIIPSILLFNKDNSIDIFLGDPNKITFENLGWIHANIEEEYNKQYKTNFFNSPGSYLLIDSNDHSHLVVDSYNRFNSNNYARYHNNFQKLLSRYNIDNLLGKNENDYSEGRINELTSNPDLFGKIREAYFLLSYANKYHMNNTQFMRFRTIIKSAKKANQQINYNEIAQEIIKDNKPN